MGSVILQVRFTYRNECHFVVCLGKCLCWLNRTHSKFVHAFTSTEGDRTCNYASKERHSSRYNGPIYLPPRANQCFCCPHVALMHPGHRRPICTLVGPIFPEEWSERCWATMSASARMKTGDSLRDAARCISIPSCKNVFQCTALVG